uniref:Sphingomyelin synthase-like domain-containing protein n=1 Tax=Panagrolaimus sp. JU765 TaxID=591449 RepID=A0AC34QID4_9BILA
MLPLLDDGYTPCPSQMGADLPAEPHKLVIVSVLLALAGLSNWAALAYIHDIVPREPLPDFIFSLVPQQTWALRLGDLMVTFCAVSMIFIFIFHKNRHVVIRRIFFIIGVLYTLRTISMLCTQLPPGYADNDFRCRDQLKPANRTWKVYLSRLLEQTIHVGFQDIEDKMLCGDLLFSGHTLVMIMSALTVSYYLPEDKKYLRYLPQSFSVIGMICMIISRTHYTVDVFFAILLSFSVFSLYHAFCEIDTYRERRNSVLNGWMIAKTILWLEENVVPGKVENAFEIPFRSSVGKLLDPSRRNERQNDTNLSNSSSAAVIENKKSCRYRYVVTHHSIFKKRKSDVEKAKSHWAKCAGGIPIGWSVKIRSTCLKVSVSRNKCNTKIIICNI